jgi:sulfur carrier protein
VDVQLNGERHAVEEGATILDLIDRDECDGVAIARNGEVVVRADWASTRVEPGDEIEIVRAVQGG